MLLDMTANTLNGQSSFSDKTPYSSLNNSVIYLIWVINLSYCQFRQVTFVLSPIFLLAVVFYEKSQQPLLFEVLDALPPHLKFFIAPSMSKTLSRSINTILIAILYKYYEEVKVIHLIIGKYSYRNLHNQLISLYKT